MTTDYFTAIGRAVSAEISRNPAQRARVKQFADNALTEHLRGSKAQDAMPSNLTKRVQHNFTGDQESIDPDLMPRGGYNNGTEAPDSDDLITLIRLLLSKLEGSDRDKFVMQLADLCSVEEVGADGTLEITHGNGNGNGSNSGRYGVPDNNRSALDRTRSGNRTGRDNAMRQRQAQDANIRVLNDKSFLSRWPDAQRINTFGRY